MEERRMFDLIVTDAAVLMPDMTVKQHQTVKVKDGKIAEICPASEGRGGFGTDRGSCVDRGSCRDGASDAAERIDGRGKLLMPGLADCHMHTGQQLLKGRILDALPMIWTRIMLPFESTLTEERMELSAKLAALEMIKSGTTAFVDAGSYHMEAAAEVYVQSGLRGVLSASTMDEAGLPESIAHTSEEAIAQTDRLYERYHGKGNLKVAYSLRSLISCSEELILSAAGRAKERHTLLQAHMNEYPNEVNFFLQRKHLRPVEYLESRGVLDENFVSAHSLLLSEREKQLLSERGVKVCHCPFSNCGKAVPDTPALLGRKVCVGLGTDGAAHGGLSLWNEMKVFRSVMNA